MDTAVAPVVQPPQGPRPSPAAPSANTATASGGVQRARARATLQRDAVHESAVVLLNELQSRQQVEAGSVHFRDMLEKALTAVRRNAQVEYLANQQYLQVEALQAQQASQTLQRRVTPVNPELLRAQTDTLARSM